MTDPGEGGIPDPTRISRAIVYKGEQAAGELLRDRDDVVFRYFADYLDGPGRPVATTLPKSRQEYRTQGGSVPAFFAGLLPEGRRLQALTSSLKTSSDDESSILGTSRSVRSWSPRSRWVTDRATPRSQGSKTS
jgi:serine/threonine-protein kinase HipA